MAELTFDTLPAAGDLTEKLKAKGLARRRDFANASQARPDALVFRNDILPDLKLVNIALADLKVSDRKTRKHSGEQLRDIMQSISTLGFCAPLLVG